MRLGAEVPRDRLGLHRRREQDQADLAEARERHGGRYELVGRLWNTEWGWAERKEWLERIVRSVVVSRGREPLSRRVEVELR
jgi:hypothetical protein